MFMDIIGILGLILGLFLIYFGITTSFTEMGNMKGFIDPPSMAITFGGTICATMIAFPLSTFKKIPKQIAIVIKNKKYDPQKYINEIVELAQEARRKGLLSLEEKANSIDDAFLKQSILLIVDAINPEKVKEMLETELDQLEERHSAGWGFYEKSSTFAPAFGMIGTLIGLINMLSHLDMDSAKGTTALAQGMSTALVTTFYGSMLANLLLVPIGNKLHMYHNEEMLCKEITMQGVLAIQAGENPRQIEESLNSYLNEKRRTSTADTSSSGGSH